MFLMVNRGVKKVSEELVPSGEVGQYKKSKKSIVLGKKKKYKKLKERIAELMELLRTEKEITAKKIAEKLDVSLPYVWTLLKQSRKRKFPVGTSSNGIHCPHTRYYYSNPPEDRVDHHMPRLITFHTPDSTYNRFVKLVGRGRVSSMLRKFMEQYIVEHEDEV